MSSGRCFVRHTDTCVLQHRSSHMAQPSETWPWNERKKRINSQQQDWKGGDVLLERAASFFQRAGRVEGTREVPEWMGDLDHNLKKTSLALSTSVQDLQKAAETRLRSFPLRATRARVAPISTGSQGSPTSTLVPWKSLRRARSETDLRHPIKEEWEELVKALEDKLKTRSDWPRRTLVRRGSTPDLGEEEIAGKGEEEHNARKAVPFKVDQIVRHARDAAQERLRIIETQWKKGISGGEKGSLEDKKNGQRRMTSAKRGANLSLMDDGRKIAIFTTASLPWLTGTAVNPLLRAAFLAKMKKKVTLLVPWLSPQDQTAVYQRQFSTPEEQENFVREWLRARVGFDSDFQLKFYPGRYAPEKGSILPVGDITKCIPDDEAEVAFLEEPEHLNWYHHGGRWSDKFEHVVGIVHTNYLEYAKREENGNLKASILKKVNQWVCRAAGCDKIIKLSDVVQKLPRATTCFVHGVSPKFLDIGKHKSDELSRNNGKSVFPKGVYFLGKVVWGKGYSELLEILDHHRSKHGVNIDVDVYGHGDDFASVKEKANQFGLALRFHGARDHADTDIQAYKVFINPSLSDVVATTTAEALAMGKFVVCADHPSNEFFREFPNCLTYKDKEEFCHCISRAMAEEPKPLTEEQRRLLTWEAATERLLKVAEPEQHTSKPNAIEGCLDRMSYMLHNSLSGVETYRVTAGAGSGTRDCLDDLADVVRFDQIKTVVGIFDRK